MFAERLAVVDGDRRLTWAETGSRARQLASALRLSGVAAGDRVAFLALNSEPLLVAHFAVPMAGGVLVAANTRLLPEEIAYIVHHSGSDILFLSGELQDLAARVQANVRRVVLGPDFERFISLGSDVPLEPWLDSEDDLCAIDYTSGTTGRPKGVM